MTLYQRGKNMVWNLDNIRFLYPPDDFTGSFTNDKMQARHKIQQDQKIKEILSQLENAQDPIEAMRALNPREHTRFLRNNLAAFTEHRCLEKAVLWLYYRKNTPFAAAEDYATWKFLFNACDPDRLYNEGSPFPYDKITAYRGSITGVGQGLSWTVSREKAAWILERWADKELGGGTVFALEITRDDILVYVEDEMKQEVILIPAIAETVKAQVITRL